MSCADMLVIPGPIPDDSQGLDQSSVLQLAVVQAQCQYLHSI